MDYRKLSRHLVKLAKSYKKKLSILESQLVVHKLTGSTLDKRFLKVVSIDNFVPNLKEGDVVGVKFKHKTDSKDIERVLKNIKEIYQLNRVYALVLKNGDWEFSIDKLSNSQLKSILGLIK